MIVLDTLALDFQESDHADGAPRACIYRRTFAAAQSIQTLTPFIYDADSFDAHADRLIARIRKIKQLARRHFAGAKNQKWLN